MFIVSITYTSPLEEVEKHLQAHVEYLKQQYHLGNFILSGRKVPRTGGVILSPLKSRQDLDAVLELDPFYIAKVGTYEITEMAPSMSSSELEFLLN